MKATRVPEFDTRDRERIYRYVERHGAVTRADLYADDVLSIDSHRVHQLVRILTRQGYLRVEDGSLRVGLTGGDVEEYHREDGLLRIRPAREEDRAGVLAAMREVLRERAYLEADAVADRLERDGALVRHNDGRSRMFFVATVDEAVVGWCHVGARDRAKRRRTAKLTVGVLEPHRRIGIGSHLLIRGCQWAAVHGFQKVRQSLPASNEEAIAFLRSNGWRVEVGIDRYEMGSEGGSAVTLAVTLSD